MVKVVFHEMFKDEYTSDPAARYGRLDSALNELSPLYDFIEPEIATEDDILRVHTKDHFDMVSESPHLFTLALLAAGGAIEAAENAINSDPAFALVRPPGHHASPDNCWGFCWYNNLALAIRKLRAEGKVNKVFILDFDLHYGDGTYHIFSRDPNVTYFHMNSANTLYYTLDKVTECDLVAISAGFDRHVEDWGNMLRTEDYKYIGREVKRMTDRLCPNKVFAVLEGGYNHNVLGNNIRNFCEGLEGKH